jgi:hypothetical protein
MFYSVCCCVLCSAALRTFPGHCLVVLCARAHYESSSLSLARRNEETQQFGAVTRDIELRYQRVGTERNVVKRSRVIKQRTKPTMGHPMPGSVWRPLAVHSAARLKWGKFINTRVVTAGLLQLILITLMKLKQIELQLSLRQITPLSTTFA